MRSECQDVTRRCATKWNRNRSKPVTAGPCIPWHPLWVREFFTWLSSLYVSLRQASPAAWVPAGSGRGSGGGPSGGGSASGGSIAPVQITQFQSSKNVPKYSPISQGAWVAFRFSPTRLRRRHRCSRGEGLCPTVPAPWDCTVAAYSSSSSS